MLICAGLQGSAFRGLSRVPDHGASSLKQPSLSKQTSFPVTAPSSTANVHSISIVAGPSGSMDKEGTLRCPFIGKPYLSEQCHGKAAREERGSKDTLLSLISDKPRLIREAERSKVSVGR